MPTAAFVVTGPKGKAASSPEDDLQLTLKIIMDHDTTSSTTTTRSTNAPLSKEHVISQILELPKALLYSEPVVADVSIASTAVATKFPLEESDTSVRVDAASTGNEHDVAAVNDVKTPSRQWEVGRAASLVTRRLWSYVWNFYGSLETLTKASTRRLFSACQKAYLILKVQLGSLGKLAKESSSRLFRACHNVYLKLKVRLGSLEEPAKASSRRLFRACQNAYMKLKGRLGWP